MKLYLIRHGETIHNKSGITQGWADSNLTDLGREQSFKAGKELVELKPTIIFASDLGRVQQSVTEMQKSLGNVPILLDWRLRERQFGEAEGTKRTAKAKEELRALASHETIKGIETIDHMTERVTHFISDLLDFIDEHESIAIVTHNGIINRFAFLTDEANYEWAVYTNGNILELELKSGD